MSYCQGCADVLRENKSLQRSLAEKERELLDCQHDLACSMLLADMNKARKYQIHSEFDRSSRRSEEGAQRDEMELRHLAYDLAEMRVRAEQAESSRDAALALVGKLKEALRKPCGCALLHDVMLTGERGIACHQVKALSLTPDPSLAARREAVEKVVEAARQAYRAIRYTSGVSLDFAADELFTALSAIDRLERGEK